MVNAHARNNLYRALYQPALYREPVGHQTETGSTITDSAASPRLVPGESDRGLTTTDVAEDLLPPTCKRPGSPTSLDWADCGNIENRSVCVPGRTRPYLRVCYVPKVLDLESRALLNITPPGSWSLGTEAAAEKKTFKTALSATLPDCRHGSCAPPPPLFFPGVQNRAWGRVGSGRRGWTKSVSGYLPWNPSCIGTSKVGKSTASYR